MSYLFYAGKVYREVDVTVVVIIRMNVMMMMMIRYIIINAFSTCVWNTTPYLVSTLSFLTFVLLGNELTTNIAFTSITL